jgi:hypothetical protein
MIGVSIPIINENQGGTGMEEIAAGIAVELIADRKNLNIQSVRNAVRSVRNSGSS